MKKLLVIILALLIPVMVFAGNTMPDLPGSLTPADYFVDFLTWIVTVVFLTGVLNRLPFLKLDDQPKRYLSWGVMFVTGLLAYLYSWGIFDAAWYIGLVYIVAGAIGSHVGYHAVKAFLIDIGLRK